MYMWFVIINTSTVSKLCEVTIPSIYNSVIMTYAYRQKCPLSLYMCFTNSPSNIICDVSRPRVTT